MFAAQRHEVIKELLIKNKTIDIASLASILDVSDVTVRKDLDKLEMEGFLSKTHGGAVLLEKDEVDPPKISIERYTEKSKIAQLAATMLGDTGSIFVGQGTTCYTMSPHIKNRPMLSVVTNNFGVASEIMGSLKNIYFIGGELSDIGGIPFTSGARSFEYLEGIFVHTAFISVTGVDLMAGLTCDNIHEANVLKEIMKISKTVVVLADHTKFNHIGIYNIAPLSSVSCVVTDRCSDEEYRVALYKKNIKLLTVFDI